jgi:hypothetical protein
VLGWWRGRTAEGAHARTRMDTGLSDCVMSRPDEKQEGTGTRDAAAKHSTSDTPVTLGPESGQARKGQHVSWPPHTGWPNARGNGLTFLHLERAEPSGGSGNIRWTYIDHRSNEERYPTLRCCRAESQTPR